MSDTLTAPTASPDTPARPKRFTVITWGCQMNVDDSDQIENLLLEDGLVKADSIEDADVVMLNTCSVRQKPEDKVFSELGRIAELKAMAPHSSKKSQSWFARASICWMPVRQKPVSLAKS